MKSGFELLNEKIGRIKTAVELGKPDRVPVVPNADAFCANYIGMPLSEFASSTEKACEAIYQTCTTIGEMDGIQVCFFSEPALSSAWLSKIKIPGRELSEGTLWQVDELELMTPDDYDTIINKGWKYFCFDFYTNRMDNLLPKIGQSMSHVPAAAQKLCEAGILPMVGNVVTIPYESFCGGRTMSRFTKDLYKMPDKVQAAMDAAMIDIIEDTRQALRTAKPFSVWVGGWRSASEFLSPKLWQRFVWPYFKKLTDVVIEEGVIPVFHLDSNWERDLEFFKAFQKGKCIISPDGSTNIYKIKEVLGSQMCIMGDVPPALLTLGTPDDVYNYSTKLINELGPSGFILSQGCCIPPNAKPENVKAMLAAATGK